MTEKQKQYGKLLALAIDSRINSQNLNGNVYRPGEPADIVGWCFIDDKPYYTVVYGDGETHNILAEPNHFLDSGYELIDE